MATGLDSHWTLPDILVQAAGSLHIEHAGYRRDALACWRETGLNTGRLTSQRDDTDTKFDFARRHTKRNHDLDLLSHSASLPDPLQGADLFDEFFAHPGCLPTYNHGSPARRQDKENEKTADQCGHPDREISTTLAAHVEPVKVMILREADCQTS
eukprot:975970-Prymnesium_polylepis.1